MNTADIETRVRQIICQQMIVEPESVVLASHFRKDLDADSLDAAEIVMTIEKEFDIDISDAEAESIETVGGVVELVSGKLATSGT